MGSMIAGRLQRPSGSVLRLAVRSGVASVVAIWVSERIGLHEPYWAGISAVVASAPTIGASVGKAISRVSATLVGLLVGLVAVAIDAHGLAGAGAAVLVTLMILPALSLADGARLGGATSLIVTAVPGHHAVSDALARGANVPLGCAIAVAIGLLVWPRHAADELRAGVARDAARAARLAAAALISYGRRPGTEESTDDAELLGSVGDLQRRSDEHRRNLNDAAREPGLRITERELLARRASEVTELIDAVSGLTRACVETPRGQGGSLLAADLHTTGASLDRLADAIDHLGFDESAEACGALRHSCARLDLSFAQSRGTKTVALDSDDVVRLLSVIHGLHDVTSVLGRLCST
jgi:uncharacterized membrane protein YccC